MRGRGGGGVLHQQRSEERQRQRQRRCATPGKESIGSESKKEKRLETGAGKGGHGDTQRPQERGREGRASVLRNPAPGDRGGPCHLQLRLLGLFPALWFPSA